MLLITPFGEIIVETNGSNCDYSFERLPNVVAGQQGMPLFNVDGRFKIVPLITAEHTFPMKIKCRVNSDFLFDDMSELETGERYSAASMYYAGIKMCIGAYDEIDEVYKKRNGCFEIVDSGLTLSDFKVNSIEIQVKNNEYYKYAHFCIAWKILLGDDYSTNGSTEVWFAAEPYLSEHEQKQP
jgi:hypothetical protein